MNKDSEPDYSSIPNPPSLGERRVRTTFNPANNGIVDKIKQKSAELIDICAAIKHEDVQMLLKMNQPSFEAVYGEKHRLLALAQTAYEEAAMWAVKAATA